MFARHVAVKLKPGTLPEFARVMDNEILPWLRKQKGFLDTITLAVADGGEIVSISFWDREDNAQAYNLTGYPEVLHSLKKTLAGTPQVRTFDVVISTLQKIVPAQAFRSAAGGPQDEPDDHSTAAYPVRH
ncbi:MAG TPA: antibiotic biosynthesis monooxygenase [Candidatus Sulfotelmatobacter sp.]|jgi:heme-degrading monooxygenase HmoA